MREERSTPLRDISIERLLHDSHCERYFGDKKLKFREGQRLLDDAERFLRERNIQSAIICLFEGLGWLHLSRVPRWALELDRVYDMLTEIYHETENLTYSLTCKASYEQKELFTTTSRLMLNDDGILDAQSIIECMGISDKWVIPNDGEIIPD